MLPAGSLALPLLTSIVLAAVLSWLGVFVVMKKMSFVADGIAHASLAGVALGVLFHANPLYTALAYTLCVGALIYYLERRTTLPVDTIITLLFTASLAVGILLMSREGGDVEALEKSLFGDAAAIGWSEIMTVAVLALGEVLFLTRYYQRLALMIFDRASAYVAGIHVDRLQLGFYLALVVAIVLGIKVFGVLLVGALMVIPASAAKLVSRSFHGAIALSAIFSVLIVGSGMPLAHAFDLPASAVVVLTGVILFTFMMGVSRFVFARRS
ncbi:MAG: metal ABC transporter permease [bacterium]|nr:metal ABC transporter permease [bacterium]